MFMAVIGGLLGAFAGLAIWATFAPATHWLTGLMAIAMGPLVGAGVRTLGHGLERPYGYLGAAISLFACVLGSALSACIVAAEQEGLPLHMALKEIDPETIPDLLVTTFDPVNVLFYLVAMFEGYYFSLRKITEAEINRVMQIFAR